MREKGEFERFSTCVLNAYLTPVIGAYALDFEPSLVVADGNGIIRDVLHFAMDTREVRLALRRATA